MKLIVSHDHRGLKSALAAELPGAAWQRCRTHFMRNLLTRVPGSAQNLVAPWCALDLRPARCQGGLVPAWPGGGATNDEWAVARRYMSAEALDQAQAGRQEPGEEIETVKQLAA